jgi:hypothetical protein
LRPQLAGADGVIGEPHLDGLVVELEQLCAPLVGLVGIAGHDEAAQPARGEDGQDRALHFRVRVLEPGPELLRHKLAPGDEIVGDHGHRTSR